MIICFLEYPEDDQPQMEGCEAVLPCQVDRQITIYLE